VSAARTAAHGKDGPVLLERHARLEPALTSAGAARRLVREALEAADRLEWSDAGELAVSELVTNAALHAHTPIEVHVEVFDDRLCVEVRDFNPTLPVQRDYDDQATTGRGMGLVATVALDCGVHSLGPEGKITWFCVGDQEERSVDDLLDAWDLDAWDDDDWDVDDAAATPPGHRRVVLRAFPITLWRAAHQHHDALLREFVLYMAARPAIDIEAQITAADEARARISAGVADLALAARRRGDIRPVAPGQLPPTPDDVHLELTVPEDAGATFVALGAVLELAESLAERGGLFARPGLAEVQALAEWTCEQVHAQLDGAEPEPWPGVAQERFEVDLSGGHLVGVPPWDHGVVSEATVGAVALDDANRIVAVSRPLADLLRWRVEDLVGRRTVTIVPPALREAYIAVFSRHLNAGESDLLGVELDLPVLRSDGVEVPCRLLVEQSTADSGRSVYIAWIDPLD
jgi:PAS domain S-box-containing protein